MIASKRHARYTDIEGTPFEIFRTPKSETGAIVVTDPETHPVAYALDCSTPLAPRDGESAPVEVDALAGLELMPKGYMAGINPVWADAYEWWFSIGYDRAKAAGTLSKPKRGTRRKTGAKSIQF